MGGGGYYAGGPRNPGELRPARAPAGLGALYYAYLTLSEGVVELPPGITVASLIVDLALAVNAVHQSGPHAAMSMDD